MRFLLSVLFLPVVFANAQPVRWIPASKLWVLDTARTSYVIGVNELNEIQSLYWGRKLTREQDLTPAHTAADYAFESREGMTTEEYPGWGGMRYYEPCLKVALPSGVRDLVLKYVSHEIRGDTLRVRLKDIQYDLFVGLEYRVYAESDIIRKQVKIENGTRETAHR